ncbi:MAG: hypothetical protein ACRC1H_16635, partial [Caldilineaceae bacterium]
PPVPPGYPTGPVANLPPTPPGYGAVATPANPLAPTPNSVTPPAATAAAKPADGAPRNPLTARTSSRPPGTSPSEPVAGQYQLSGTPPPRTSAAAAPGAPAAGAAAPLAQAPAAIAGPAPAPAVVVTPAPAAVAGATVAIAAASASRPAEPAPAPAGPVRNPLTANIRPTSETQITPLPAEPVNPNFALQSEDGAPAVSRRSLAWVETPPILPGATLGVDIHVAPLSGSKARGRRVEFSVFTMAAEDLAGQVKEWKVNVVLGE